MKVIIIGSGIAGITFAEKIRELSPNTKITVLSKENDGYYSRPMLSMGFSDDDIEDDIIIEPFSELLNKNICIISGIEVTGIDRHQHLVNIKGVEEIESLEYDKLILATGSAAFIPPPFLPYRENFFLLNSLIDLINLRKFRQCILEKNKRVNWAIIGGGLIGCEVASDLVLAGDQVSLFHAMDRLMERQLVEQDSETLLKVMRSSAIDIRLNQTISGFEKKANKVVVISDETQDHYDGAIVSCGFKPRTELAKNAELDIGRGIKTNQMLQTSDQNIYALGDVAELPNGKLYAFIKPIRHQALWLAAHLVHNTHEPWVSPEFNPSAKVNNFTASHPYLF